MNADKMKENNCKRIQNVLYLRENPIMQLTVSIVEPSEVRAIWEKSFVINQHCFLTLL